MSNPFTHLLVLGHRGAPDRAMENTLESLALALREGADGVEIDVRPAGDGTPVVIHDETLSRTFGMEGSVGELSWPALQRLTGARLPSLQQVAAWAAASQAWLNVEIKAAGVEAATLELLASHALLPRCFISSFDERIIAELGRLHPDARCFLLTEEWNDSAHDRFVASGAMGVCLRVDAASPLNLDVLRQAGVPVVVWTVDDPARVARLADLGVAAVITNRPAEAVSALRGRHSR